MPPTVMLGPLLMVRPALLIRVSPIVTLSRSRSRLRVTVTWPSWSAPLWATPMLLSPLKVTLPFGPILALLPSASLTFQPAEARSATPLSCATLTASVSCKPAATPVIWRVFPVAASPTLTAPRVLFQVALVSVEASFVNGSYPAIPAAVLATEPAPRATPSVMEAVAPLPRAIELTAPVETTAALPMAMALLAPVWALALLPMARALVADVAA
ncbi:hypothetical protein FQZ97_657160 [compost metagenome]